MEGMKMKAMNIKEAWAMADEIFPTDYEKDEQGSKNAGYPIYRSTLSADCTDKYQPWYCQISDLGSRLEVTVTMADWTQEVTNIWIEAPAEPKSEEPENMKERRTLADRLIKIHFLFTEELLEDLESKAKEDAAVKSMEESPDDGQIHCMILTADNNIRVMKDVVGETQRVVRYLLSKENFIESWMLAGVNAMLDSIKQGKDGIPYDLPHSISGLLGMDW